MGVHAWAEKGDVAHIVDPWGLGLAVSENSIYFAMDIE